MLAKQLIINTTEIALPPPFLWANEVAPLSCLAAGLLSSADYAPSFSQVILEATLVPLDIMVSCKCHKALNCQFTIPAISKDHPDFLQLVTQIL